MIILNNKQAALCYDVQSQISKLKPSTPPSTPSAQQPAGEFTYSCAYCRISKYGNIPSFNTSDLLERHVIKKHPGWTAYPGSADIQKFEREFREKTIRSIKSKVAEIAKTNETGNGIMFGSKEES